MNWFPYAIDAVEGALLGLLLWAVWVISDAVKQLQQIELKRAQDFKKESGGE